MMMVIFVNVFVKHEVPTIWIPSFRIVQGHSRPWHRRHDQSFKMVVSLASHCRPKNATIPIMGTTPKLGKATNEPGSSVFLLRSSTVRGF